MAKKQQFYVVWQGINPGVYTSWSECKAQVHRVENALYKAFPTLEDAERAFTENPWKHLKSRSNSPTRSPQYKNKPVSNRNRSDIIASSIAVDAACSGNPGLLEYRGVFVGDGKQVFHNGPLEEGTNNIGEFLAIVHALALLKQKESNIPVYSDSATAIKWVEKKKCNTKLAVTDRNKPLFELINRAEKWLNKNTYNNPIIKWETRLWGEIPADFGRK